MIRKPQLFGQLDPGFVGLHANEQIGAHGPAEHEAARPTGPGLPARRRFRSRRSFDGLVDRAEAACHLSAVLVRLSGRAIKLLFLRQNVGGHAAVALPAICPAVGGFAGDVIAAPAVVAQAAAGNVVDDHPVPLVETPEPLALLTMTPQGLMACDGAGNVALRPLAHVFPVDTPDVAPQIVVALV